MFTLRRVAFVMVLSGSAAAVPPAMAQGTTGDGAAPRLEGPIPRSEPIPSEAPPARTQELRDPVRESDREREQVPAHEAMGDEARGDEVGQAPLRVLKAPPRPIAERPAIRRPDPRARWVPGYWAWDRARAEYVWVGGTWRVSEPGMAWVPGRWLRDARGWYRIAGAWRPVDARVAVVADDDPALAAAEPSWRASGPPAQHPADEPGPAPGPDSFFIPGHYIPVGEGVSWTPGFWAQVQPGWDWIPARWVRRPEGWEFRAGSWARETSFTKRADPARRTQPAPPGPEAERDAIAEANQGERDRDRDPAPGLPPLPQPPVILLPGARVRYGHVIRPPGYYPYGPNGVVVPDEVPPFVRRLMDRVMP